MKKTALTTAALLSALCLLAANAAAADSYITEKLEITLRSGPGVDYRIISMIQGGTPINIAEAGEEWTKVVTERGTEGWVLNRFVTDVVPVGPRFTKALSELEAARAELKKTKEALGKARKDASQSAAKAKKTASAAARADKELQALKAKNAKPAELEAEIVKLEAVAATNAKKMAELQEENRMLAARQKFYWFFSGGVVILLGWALGFFYSSSKSKLSEKSKIRF